jgi:hypothetical protein
MVQTDGRWFWGKDLKLGRQEQAALGKQGTSNQRSEDCTKARNHLRMGKS